MNSGRILFLGLTLVSAGVADAKYDRALDGKTKIWKDSSERQLEAAWSGDRDEKGYATGNGTLIWYRVNHTWETGSFLPGSKYIRVGESKGKMVDGKFEGSVVTVDAKGKTYHAKFADGEKTGDWIAGSGSGSSKKAKEQPSKPAVAEVAANPEPAAPAEAPPPAPKLEQHVAEKPAASPPVTAPAPQKDVAVVTSPAEKSFPSSDSLRSLAMPPSSLRMASLNEASKRSSAPPPETDEPATSTANAAEAEPAVASSPASSSVNDDDARTVAALDTEFQSAVKTNDVGAIDRILADDFVLMRGEGKTLTKTDLLKQAREKHAKYERHEIESGSQKVRVWRDTAVITETLWVKGAEAGMPVDHKVSVTETYVRTPQGWRYVSGQASTAGK